MPWPGGKRGHGAQGYAEYVLELLDNDEQLLSALTLADSCKIARNDACPCKSGRKYKKCCLYRVDDIQRRVGTTMLGYALYRRVGSER